MPTVYWMADEGVYAMLENVMKQWHQHLVNAGVKIGIVFAYSGKEGHPAVKHGGYPAAATIKIVPLKDRISKNYDAEMLVDVEHWKSSDHTSRVALFDHELCHLDIKHKKSTQENNGEDGDEEGSPTAALEVALDDIGRPQLKLIKGSWNVGDGFDAVIRRHGRSALEYRNINHAIHHVDAVLSDFVPPQADNDS